MMAGKSSKRGPHPADRHVGRRVCERRIRLGYSQSDLAQALGVSFQQVQKYENGANRISASKLWEAAIFLGADISDFYRGYEPEPAGMAEEGVAFDQGRPTRYAMEIIRLAPRLSVARQKLALELISDMARRGEPDDED